MSQMHAPRGSKGPPWICEQSTQKLIFVRPVTQETTLAQNDVGQQMLTEYSPQTPDQWQVAALGRSVFRSANVGDPIPTYQEIVAAQGVVPNPVSAQIAVDWSTGTGQDSRAICDVGSSFHFTGYGTSVKAWLLVEPGMRLLTNGDNPGVFDQAGDFEIVVLYTGVMVGAEFSTRALYQATVGVTIPALGTRDLRIPSGAQFISAAQTSAGAAATSFSQINISGQEVGVLAFDAARRHLPRQRIAGNARAIRTGPVAADARHFSVIYEIEP